jgi:hypothetical protein
MKQGVVMICASRFYETRTHLKTASGLIHEVAGEREAPLGQSQVTQGSKEIDAPRPSKNGNSIAPNSMNPTH